MADQDQQDDTQDEELLLTDEDQVEGDPPENDDDAPPANDDTADDEFSIELEGEEPPEEETSLVRQLREELRAAQKERAELRKAVAPKIEVGKKPDLWDDCEGDVEQYDAEVAKWNERKRQAEDQERETERAAEVKNQEYQRQFVNYRAKAAQLPVKDFDDAEKQVVSALPELLQSAVVAYADDPAKVVYALAKHPAKLAALAQEPDPIKFVLAMRDLERNLKVVNRKRPPNPEAETVQSGTAHLSGGDKELQRLEKEAERTGNRSKLVAYKASKRAA